MIETNDRRPSQWTASVTWSIFHGRTIEPNAETFFILIVGTTAFAAKVDERKGKRVPFSIITGHHNGEGEDVGAV